MNERRIRCIASMIADEVDAEAGPKVGPVQKAVPVAEGVSASSRIAMPYFEEAPGFGAAFKEFLVFCQQVSDKHMEEDFPTLDKPQISSMEGGRYIRVVISRHGQRSVFCFVDKTSGDILKADGWKAPAKHARGNVLDKNSWKSAIGPYGAAYLR